MNYMTRHVINTPVTIFSTTLVQTLDGDIRVEYTWFHSCSQDSVLKVLVLRQWSLRSTWPRVHTLSKGMSVIIELTVIV